MKSEEQKVTVELSTDEIGLACVALDSLSNALKKLALEAQNEIKNNREVEMTQRVELIAAVNGVRGCTELANYNVKSSEEFYTETCGH